MRSMTVMKKSYITDKRLITKHPIENEDSIIRELKNEFLGLLRKSISISLEDKVKLLTKFDSLTIEQIKSGIEILSRENGIKERHSESYFELLELKKIEWPIVLRQAKAVNNIKTI